MNVKLLQLTKNDLTLARQLLSVFATAFNEEEQYQHTSPTDQHLVKLLNNPHYIALVAIHEQSVIGGLAAYELQKIEREDSEIYLYDLAVLEPFRRSGIATELIANLKNLAHQRGAWVIFVSADLADDPAIALYSKLGQREDVLHFDIPVQLTPKNRNS